MILDIDSLKAFLEITTMDDDERLQMAMGVAEGEAAKHCGRNQFEHAWLVKTFDLDTEFRTKLIVPVRPIVAVPRVTYGDEGFGFVGSDVTTGVPGEIDFPNHGLSTGAGPFAFVTQPGGVLPVPLSSALDYYIIAVDTSTIRLALTAQDALDGIAISITDASGIGLHRLIGPFIDRRSLTYNPDSGVIGLQRGAQWPKTSVSVVFRAGLCEDGNDAPDDLFGALLEQAAFRFRQGGKGGRLGLVGSEKPAGVRDQYVVSEWAPGVLSVLANYRLWNI